MKYIDTHGHLNSKEFRDNYKKYIEDAKKANVLKIIIPGTNKEDSYEAINIASKFDNIYAMVSLHPVDGYKIEDIEWLNQIDVTKIIGIGECGIDLYRPTNPPINIQKEIFRIHIRFAQKNNLPVIIHSRNAEKETYDVLNEKEFLGINFVIHCCTMNKEWVMKFVDMGGYISFSGIVTFKNAVEIQEAAKSIPLNQILSETDAPYLSPVPYRGKVNNPQYVIYIAEYIANIRKESREEVINALWNNAHRIFSI